MILFKDSRSRMGFVDSLGIKIELMRFLRSGGATNRENVSAGNTTSSSMNAIKGVETDSAPRLPC